MEKTSAKLLAAAYPKRKPWSTKGDYGRVLVVGGSLEYTGSPVFNCMAAYAAGADLVTLLAPHRAANIAAGYAPEIIAPPLEGDFLQPTHVHKVLKQAEKADALVIGGGLGRRADTREAVFEILEKTSIPTVVDADALRFAAEKPERLAGRENMLFTPHAGEMAQLYGSGMITDEVPERARVTRAVARKFGATILLKGAVDVITDGKRVMLDYEGSPYLTKGGIGDVTAGVCGALLARGIPAFEAAATAAFIVGRAGKEAAKTYGESTLPSKIIRQISKSLPRHQ